MLPVVLAFGILGLCMGSFLNVVILRRGRRAFSGRSSCMSCAKTLAWYDLVPVVSWVFLRGRCRACGSSISIQYPLVEGATAILFAFFGMWVLGP
jgi:leader peptidase (prepilin peptidase)/N-methyltransferase